MSLIIKLKNVNFSTSGLPVLKRTAAGFDRNGLVGLYLMEDGVVGSAYSGGYVDSSGNGNHAARRGNWSAPTRRSYGFETNASTGKGLCIETPILMSQQMTWVFAGRSTTPIGTVGRYPTVFGPTRGINLSEIGNHENNRDFVLNTDATSTAGNNTFGKYSAVAWPGVSVRSWLGGQNSASMNGIIAASADGIAGTFLMKRNNGTSNISESGLGPMLSEYASTTDKVCFGLWPMQLSTQNSGEIMLAACYNRALSSTELDDVISAAKTRLELRGVVF